MNAACALLLLLVMAGAVAEAEAVAEASRTWPGGSHWSSFRFSPSKLL